jgi:hypothetical protein
VKIDDQVALKTAFRAEDFSWRQMSGAFSFQSEAVKWMGENYASFFRRRQRVK